ncbi:MAG TPA: hypothetical protein VFZ61_22860 [Polyangiales bacterium]
MLPAVVVFSHRDRRLALLEPCRLGVGPHASAPLAAWEAEPILARALTLGGLEHSIRAAYERSASAPAREPGRSELLGWLTQQLRRRRLLLVDLNANHAGATSSAADPADPLLREVDAELTALQRSDLSHRGHLYRIMRAGGRELRNRASFEVLQEREARALMTEMAEDAAQPTDQRAHLARLLALSARNEPSFRTSSLLLLRQPRHYTKPEAQAAPVTPSQLRQQAHFIEIEVVDASEQPVPQVALELVLADGTSRRLSTNDDGIARASPVPVGNTIVRVVDRDGSEWKAPGAKRSSKSGPSRTHLVKQGQCLSRIAASYGFRDWRVVWQFDENAALRKKRKNPNVLYPGDQLAIPGMAIHEIERATDASHRIQMKAVEATTELAITLADDEGAPLSGPYELRWGSDPEPKLTGQLDGSGGLKQEVPIHVQKIELLLPERFEVYLLSPSRLDPTEDESGAFVPSGVAARLCGLHYLYEAENVSAEDLRHALIAFQREEMGQEAPSGEIDSATCSKLEELYGA